MQKRNEILLHGNGSVSRGLVLSEVEAAAVIAEKGNERSPRSLRSLAMTKKTGKEIKS